MSDRKRRDRMKAKALEREEARRQSEAAAAASGATPPEPKKPDVVVAKSATDKPVVANPRTRARDEDDHD